jgi:hypothetical protein
MGISFGKCCIVREYQGCAPGFERERRVGKTGSGFFCVHTRRQKPDKRGRAARSMTAAQTNGIIPTYGKYPDLMCGEFPRFKEPNRSERETATHPAAMERDLRARK